jgi:hypothetical protein
MKFSNCLFSGIYKIRVICLGNKSIPIWLSEIMLQQTRVAQGTPYFYLSQILLFFDLAEADEEEQC